MTAISLRGVGKSYALYDHTLDRIKEIVTGHPRHRTRVALHPIDLEIGRGEVVGLIGRNGAGKSTLLKLVAGTLTPSSGEIRVDGQVSALLELGTGFHHDLTGRENVYLGGAVRGLSVREIDRLYPGIVEFAGLAEFMEQPVKTFSSGMLVRLAFALATCIEPDILIIDEALSVGDAAFAHKSFERIMGFKNDGKTILFCSHSMYQVEAICNRVIWLHEGAVRMVGEPAAVIAAYNAYLDSLNGGAGQAPAEVAAPAPEPAAVALEPGRPARLLDVQVSAGPHSGRSLEIVSHQSDLKIRIRFVSDPAIPCPRLAVTISGPDGRIISSTGNWVDGLEIRRDSAGQAEVTVCFPRLALLKGQYWLNVYLLSHEGIFPFDQAELVAELQVRQQTLEQGIVSLPRTWSQAPLPA
ncbi:MAG TPA: ABC transporter ATP-binding protein [Candidatus Competibacteraceae bacterium]|nr:ABC transporter ATP-binding protein [Candidatus Competibacteraceae bacterium]